MTHHGPGGAPGLGAQPGHPQAHWCWVVAQFPQKGERTGFTRNGVTLHLPLKRRFVFLFPCLLNDLNCLERDPKGILVRRAANLFSGI